MVSLGAGADAAVAEAYDFGRHSHVVDVGGGHGQLLSAILTRHPNLTGALLIARPGSRQPPWGQVKLHEPN